MRGQTLRAVGAFNYMALVVDDLDATLERLQIELVACGSAIPEQRNVYA